MHSRCRSWGQKPTIGLGPSCWSHHMLRVVTALLAPPIAHGTDDRPEFATLCGEDVLGPRRTHRIEAPLDDAILLKTPQTLR